MSQKNQNTAIDLEALRQKISGESIFISSVINKIPSMSCQGGSDDDEEDDVSSGSEANEDSDVVEGSQSQRPNNSEVAINSHKGKRRGGIKHLMKKDSLECNPDRKKQEKGECKVNKQTKPPEQNKAGFSSDGKMVFSKFDFSEVGTYVEEKKKKKVCNDPRRILEKLKERHELLQKLKSEGNEEKALKLKEKDGWSKAFSKVQGIKVRDDPELLKEAIYKQDLRKAKHKKLWESREEKVKKAMEYKVIKRETNIKAKRDVKLKHRLKKALKKGRIIPGFS